MTSLSKLFKEYRYVFLPVIIGVFLVYIIFAYIILLEESSSLRTTLFDREHIIQSLEFQIKQMKKDRADTVRYMIFTIQNIDHDEFTKMNDYLTFDSSIREKDVSDDVVKHIQKIFKKYHDGNNIYVDIAENDDYNNFLMIKEDYNSINVSINEKIKQYNDMVDDYNRMHNKLEYKIAMLLKPYDMSSFQKMELEE